MATSTASVRPDKISIVQSGEQSTLQAPNNLHGITIEPSLVSTQRGSHLYAESNQKPTPLLTSKVVKSTAQPKPTVSRVTSGVTTIFFTDSSIDPKMPLFVDSNAPIESTRYVTSVESTTRTLTLTTTKVCHYRSFIHFLNSSLQVYYTRDSPLTITSVLTTTIPPRTFVSTIIGSRTILGIPGDSQSGTVQPTQVLKETMSSTKSVTVSDSRSPFQRPTRKPGTGPFRAPTRAPESPKPFKTSAPRPRVPYKPPPPSQPPILSGVSEGPYVPSKKATSAPLPKTTTRPSILDIDQCKPGCNAANKEICKENDGKFRCDCRQGFIRKDDKHVCEG